MTEQTATQYDGKPLAMYHIELAAAQVFPHASPDGRTMDFALELDEEITDEASAERVAEVISLQVREYLCEERDTACCPEFTGGEERQLTVELIAYLRATNSLRRAMAHHTPAPR